MNEVLLHIGMHKTGTSSIQHSFHGFDNGDTKYADLGPANHSVAIYSMFTTAPEKYDAHQRVGRSAGEIESFNRDKERLLRRELATDRRRLIISGEDISSLAVGAVARLAAFIEASGRSTSIIVYIRDPMTYASSRLQQVIKNGASQPVLRTPKYQHRLEKFIDQFEIVRFVAFDRAKFPNGSVVQDFAQQLGVSAAGMTEHTANVGLSMDAIKLINLFNRYGTKTEGHLKAHKVRAMFVDVLAKNFPGEKFAIPDYALSQTIDHDDIDWMTRTAGFNPLQNDPGAAAPFDLSDFLAFDAQAEIDVRDHLRHILSQARIRHHRNDDLAALLTRIYSALYDARQRRRMLAA